jgi:hypothetical protein
MSSTCDGCIDLALPQNAGVDVGIDGHLRVRSKLPQDIVNSLSFADQFALGGQVAAEFGMEGMPGHVSYKNQGIFHIL